MARGLALAVLSGRVIALWRRGRPLDRSRATLLVVGLTGDWALVVATAFDASLAAMEVARLRWRRRPSNRWEVGDAASEPRGVGVRARSDRGMRRAGVRTRLSGASRHRVRPPADPRGAGRAGRLDAVRERSLPRLGVDTATAGLGRGLGVGDPPGRPGGVGRAGNPVEDRRVAGGAMPVRGRADRRRGAAGRLVPRPHAPLGAVHRAPRPEDVPALVAAQPGVQPGGEPLPRRGPRRLVGPVPRPRRLRRHVVGLRPRLPGGSPRPGTALSTR